MTARYVKSPLVFIASAWLIHIASWFLPVIKPAGGHTELFAPFEGWVALRAALSPLVPYEDLEGLHFATWYYAALAVVSAATTILFILGSPLVVWRGSRSVRMKCAWIAIGAFVVNSHWYVSSRGDLSYGYFVWWLSFLLLGIGLFGIASRDTT